MKSKPAKEKAAAVPSPPPPPAPQAEPEPPSPSPSLQEPEVLSSRRDPMLLVSEPPRKKILFNPSAGEVHRREKGAPWRKAVDERMTTTNARAREEQREKRRWGLAKQVQDGLIHNYNINYGVAELATLLKEGMTLKREPPPHELTAHEVGYVQLLAAAEKYDLKQLVLLLDKFPKGRAVTAPSSKRPQ